MMGVMVFLTSSLNFEHFSCFVTDLQLEDHEKIAWQQMEKKYQVLRVGGLDTYQVNLSISFQPPLLPLMQIHQIALQVLFVG